MKIIFETLDGLRSEPVEWPDSHESFYIKRVIRDSSVTQVPDIKYREYMLTKRIEAGLFLYHEV